MTEAGHPRRRRRILRLIAVERSVRGAVLLAAGIYLFFHLRSDFGRLADRAMRAVELDPRRALLHRIVEYLHHVPTTQVRIAAAGAVAYGILELTEGVGLWLERLWAEYLTVIATSLLIPFEVYELVHRPTVWKAGGLVFNVAIVAYLALLLRSRRHVRQPHR